MYTDYYVIVHDDESSDLPHTLINVLRKLQFYPLTELETRTIQNMYSLKYNKPLAPLDLTDEDIQYMICKVVIARTINTNTDLHINYICNSCSLYNHILHNMNIDCKNGQQFNSSRYHTMELFH